MLKNGEVMSLDEIEDWEARLDRQDACLNGAVLDRPVVVMSCDRPGVCPLEEKKFRSQKERWFDVENQVRQEKHKIESTLYFGDALPSTTPNLGPDYFASLFGGELEFEESTSYIRHWLGEWEDWDSKIAYSEQSVYFQKMEELYGAFLEQLSGKAYVGYPDLHPGSDCLAAFRDPMNFNFDILEQPDEIAKGLKTVTQQFFKTYAHYSAKLSAAGQPCCSWLGIVSRHMYHIPSSDFSYMISPSSFDELFLEGLREENQCFEKNVHHLDGPGCLNHLESLLGIDEMNMIQWVWGTGNGRASDHIDTLKRIQQAGRGLHLPVELDELNLVMNELHPEGVWLEVDISTPDEAKAVLNQVRGWT
jgi:hypothetical protein